MAILTITAINLSCVPDTTFTTTVSFRPVGGGSYFTMGSTVTNPDGSFQTPILVGPLDPNTCYQIRFTTSGLPYETCILTTVVCTPDGSGGLTTTTTTTTTTTSTTTTSTTTTSTTTTSTTTTTTIIPYSYFLASPYACSDCSVPSGDIVLVSILTGLLPLVLGRFYTPSSPDGNVYQIVSLTEQTPDISVLLTGLNYSTCTLACPD